MQQRAKDPFRFRSHGHLTELTGLKAKNLSELVTILRQAPDAMVYQHTHSFLEQHQYLVPQSTNDFAVWVTESLGEDALGEMLASVDTFVYSDLTSLRDALVRVLEEHITTQGDDHREAMPGREFHFMRSVSLILDIPQQANSLSEFLAMLRQVSLDSIYFHIFEAKLRLGRGKNDFSLWLQNSLGEEGLAREIASIDPYTYSLEGLRSALIRIIEKRME